MILDEASKHDLRYKIVNDFQYCRCYESNTKRKTKEARIFEFTAYDGTMTMIQLLYLLWVIMDEVALEHITSELIAAFPELTDYYYKARIPTVIEAQQFVCRKHTCNVLLNNVRRHDNALQIVREERFRRSIDQNKVLRHVLEEYPISASLLPDRLMFMYELIDPIAAEGIKAGEDPDEARWRTAYMVARVYGLPEFVWGVQDWGDESDEEGDAEEEPFGEEVAGEEAEGEQRDRGDDPDDDLWDLYGMRDDDSMDANMDL